VPYLSLTSSSSSSSSSSKKKTKTTDPLKSGTSDLALELLIAADRYGIKSLVDECCLRLCQTLTIANVIDRFVVAEKCTAVPEKLHTTCLQFMARDSTRLQEMICHPTFKRLDATQLLAVMTALTPLGKTQGTKRQRTESEDLLSTAISETAVDTEDGGGGGGGGDGDKLVAVTYEGVKRLCVTELKD